MFPRPAPLFQRSVAGGLTDSGRAPLSATALEPLLAELTAFVHRARLAPAAGGDAPGTQDEDGCGASAVDITDAPIAELVRTVEMIRHAALHDPLTGLANRSLILDHLQLALARASRGPGLAAVIFLDLDGFKQINDTLGHAAGDELLVRIAERLGPALRPADTLGRWGGDEFVVVCEDLERASDAPAIAARIAAAFADPFAAADRELHVGASIGVAVSGGTHQPATLIAAADSAMYHAKRDSTRPRTGPDAAANPAGLPKQERLTRRLREVLATVEVDDDPPAAA